MECHTGEARIKSPYEVQVNGKVLTTRNIVIATGARPAVPQIEGIEEVDYLTSDTVWNIRKKPENLLVLGGGPIGSELTQAFARLGCSVTQVQRNKRLLPKEDPEVSQMFWKVSKRTESMYCYNTPLKNSLNGKEKILWSVSIMGALLKYYSILC